VLRRFGVGAALLALPIAAGLGTLALGITPTLLVAAGVMVARPATAPVRRPRNLGFRFAPQSIASHAIAGFEVPVKAVFQREANLRALRRLLARA